MTVLPAPADADMALRSSPRVADVAPPNDAGHVDATACHGRSDCHGEHCCVALDQARFCSRTCPGAAIAVACETMEDCPADGQLGVMSEHRTFVACADGVCDGPRIRDRDPTCAACMEEDCESAKNACDQDALCKRAYLALRACMKAVGSNEAGRTGCWDQFQVSGGLRAEPNLRNCTTLRCPSCEGPAPRKKIRAAGAL